MPANFVGAMVFNAAAPSGITYGITRSWNYLGPAGNCTPTYINTSAGVFTWTNFDSFFSNAAGKDVVFTLGDTPDYLVTRAAVGGSSHTTKSNMVADDLGTWAAVVTAIVSRAKNTWGRTGLKWELWNELHQTSFFNDSLSLLGPYTRVTVQAILAVDPTAVILSPSIGVLATTYSSYLTGWANAGDGAGSTSKKWVNGISYHGYYGTAFKPTDAVNDWYALQSILAGISLNLPVWITESGYAAADPQQAVDHKRHMMIAAAFGAQCYIGNEQDAGYTFSFNTITTDWNAAAALLAAGAVISNPVAGPYAFQVVINGTTYTF